MNPLLTDVVQEIIDEDLRDILERTGEVSVILMVQLIRNMGVWEDTHAPSDEETE